MFRKCPACGCDQYTSLSKIQMTLPNGVGLPNTYHIVSCEQCGCCFADTVATQKDYDHYYSMFNFYGGQASGENKQSQTAFAKVYEFTKAHLSPMANILDIGFGRGKLLLGLHHLGYTNLFGIDPSPASVAALEKCGIPAFCGSIYNEPASLNLKGKMDLAFLMSVAEHLLEPQTALCQVSKYLKSDGYLIVDIPDYSLCDKVDLPIPNQFNQEHINYFSSESFSTMLMGTDFRILASTKIEIKVHKGYEYSQLFFLQKHTRNQKCILTKDIRTRGAIEKYLTKQAQNTEKIMDTITALYEKQIPLIIWGSGALAMHLMSSSELNKCNIIAFADENPLKTGMEIAGIKVIPPDAVKRYPDAAILVCVMKYVPDVQRKISMLKLPNQVIFIT